MLGKLFAVPFVELHELLIGTSFLNRSQFLAEQVLDELIGAEIGFLNLAVDELALDRVETREFARSIKPLSPRERVTSVLSAEIKEVLAVWNDVLKGVRRDVAEVLW